MKELKRTAFLKNGSKKFSPVNLFSEKDAHCFHIFLQHTKNSSAIMAKN